MVRIAQPEEQSQEGRRNALPQGQDASRRWSCKRKRKGQKLREAVVLACNKHREGVARAAPKAAQHAKAKYGKTDYPFQFFFIHIAHFTSKRVDRTVNQAASKSGFE
jgi:hypothetical protein